MAKRKLNRDELKMSEIGLRGNEKQLEEMNTKLKIVNFKLDIEVPHNFETEIERFKQMKKQVASEQVKIEQTIKILKDQIENGVEVKEEK